MRAVKSNDMEMFHPTATLNASDVQLYTGHITEGLEEVMGSCGGRLLNMQLPAGLVISPSEESRARRASSLPATQPHEIIGDAYSWTSDME